MTIADLKKLTIALLVTLAIASHIQAKTLDFVIEALALVESGNDEKAIGDSGLAVGALQIHPITVREANRILGERRFSYSDRFNADSSKQIAKIILRYWGKQYAETYGIQPTALTYAYIWNGGPKGIHYYGNPRYGDPSNRQKLESYVKKLLQVL